jgi:outer membrane protein
MKNTWPELFLYFPAAITICFFHLFASSAFAADKVPLKIGIINMQRILTESRTAKNYQAVFFKDWERKKAVLAAKEKEIRRLDEEIKNPGARITASALKEKTGTLSRQMKEIKQLREDMEEELRKKDIELSRKIVADLKKVLVTFSKTEGYTLILEKNSTVLSDEAMDITDQLIKLYDAQHK